MDDFKAIILAMVILILPEALIWYFVPFWYAWALGVVFGTIWTIVVIYAYVDAMEGWRFFLSGMLGVLNLPSALLVPNGLSFSAIDVLMFTALSITGFYNFYRVNFLEESEEEKEEEKAQDKEWEDKKW